MPTAISGAVLALLNNTAVVGLIGGAGVVAIANAAPALLLGLAASVGSNVVSNALRRNQQRNQQSSVPKPEDGKYNLKQTVPPLTYVLGEVKKAGDYALLEEKNGIAYHILVHAAHSIKGFKEHWLHDEQVTLNGSGTVVSPGHFASKVSLFTRLGADASTAYSQVTSAFPSIWTSDHRGDGLASVLMMARSTSAEDFQKVYPSGMPNHTAVVEGNDRIYDPRTESSGYTKNLALHRLWHLTHPVGGKLSLEDMYLPDWESNADVCDEDVTNRQGGTEKRYHGGLWFRADSDPVQVGRLMDEAAQQVIYERADGLIGVHAGEFVTPDVRLTAVDIKTLGYDANRRKSSTVLAVRGRYTDPAKKFNTADAAIYGDPYPTEDERTKTVENQAVQSHNHMARLQKPAFIRANAPRVQIVAHYEAAREVPYRRYIRVHYPPRLNEAVVEIIGRPKLSLVNLTYSFEGIVIPSTIYEFNATTEEGAPGSNVEIIPPGDVPVPENFDVLIQESVTGGSTAAYALGSWDLIDETFEVELQWEPTGGGSPQSARSVAGATEVRSAYLSDGVEYRFRARNWSVDTPSDWTEWVVRTATADDIPPDEVTFIGPVDVSTAGEATFTWEAPNSANYHAAQVWVNTSNDFGTATLEATEYGAPNAEDSATVPLAAGTKYAWLVAINASGVQASPVATGSFTVT